MVSIDRAPLYAALSPASATALSMQPVQARTARHVAKAPRSAVERKSMAATIAHLSRGANAKAVRPEASLASAMLPWVLGPMPRSMTLQARQEHLLLVGAGVV